MTTEGNTTITLHNESIVSLIDLLKLVEHDATGNAYRDKIRGIRGTIESQYHPDPPSEPGIVAIAGLPAAGKTFVGNKLAQLLEAPTVSMGDQVRDHYESEFGEAPETGDDIRSWVEDIRKRNPRMIPEWTVDAITADYSDENVVIVDGLRTEVDLTVLEERFDPFHLIEVKSSFLTRLERIQERDREGEGDYTPYDLVDRDRQEMGWGVQSVLENDGADLTIKNQFSAPGMSRIIMNVADNSLPYDVPEYLDRENVSFEGEDSSSDSTDLKLRDEGLLSQGKYEVRTNPETDKKFA